MICLRNSLSVREARNRSAGFNGKEAEQREVTNSTWSRLTEVESYMGVLSTSPRRCKQSSGMQTQPHHFISSPQRQPQEAFPWGEAA